MRRDTSRMLENLSALPAVVKEMDTLIDRAYILLDEIHQTEPLTKPTHDLIDALLRDMGAT